MPRILCAALVAAAASGATAGTDVKRAGSHLSVDVDGTAAGGTWEIRDAAGRFCSSGPTAAGRTKIVVPKIASNADLSVVVKTPRGEVASRVAVPGQRVITSFERPDEAVTIYQVPVRTYFARGVGKAETGRLEHFTTDALQQIKELGSDYIWLTGLLEASAPDNTDPDVASAC